MATVASVYEDRRVSIGRVFKRAFSAIGLNPVVILSLALLIGAVPGIVMTYLFYRLGIFSPQAMMAGTISRSAFIGAAFLSFIIGMIISALVQGALTRATVSANEGVKATIGESISTALRVVLPLIGLTLLWAFGVGVGFILLVVPGIILLMMWAVAVPSLVIERQGVFAAFRRSAELTKGARWKIFGLSLVLIVIYWLLSLLVGLVGLGVYSATSLTGLNVTNLIGSLIVSTLFNTLWGTVQPSLYVELLEWKEGGSLDKLEDVFA